jgi:hypothetical protein
MPTFLIYLILKLLDRIDKRLKFIILDYKESTDRIVDICYF